MNLSRPLWSAAEVALATNGTPTAFFEADSVSIDSRSVKKGDLFIALRGEHFDGHDFINKAIEQGAVAAIVDHVPKSVPSDFPLVKTANTTDALTDLGAFSRKRSNATIIAITGSSGKTSVKEACHLVFKDQALTYATEGNFNNQYGAPLSLSRMHPDMKYGIFELGMSSPGELEALSKLVQPHVAVITNVSAAHLAFFNSVEGIADAKSEICAGLAKKGTLILNRDNPFFDHLTEKAHSYGVSQIVSFGSHNEADYHLDDYQVDSSGYKINANCLGNKINFSLSLKGTHHIYNALTTLAIVNAAGANLNTATQTLALYRAPSGRGKCHIIELDKGTITLIDDSYNANPSSVTAALKTLAELGKSNRTIAILGDMLELGKESITMHQALKAPILENNIDIILTVGEHMQHLFESLPKEIQGNHCSNATDALNALKAIIKSGDTILVKGSNSLHMDKIIKNFLSEETVL